MATETQTLHPREAQMDPREAQVIICAECGLFELRTAREMREHGRCRGAAPGAPCPVCAGT